MKRLWKLALLCAPLMMLAPRGTRADGAGVAIVVVVGAATNVSSLSKGDLKRLYLGEPVSAGGTNLVPFNAQPGSPERTAFEKLAVGMSTDELGRYWVDRKIRGQGDPPRALPTPQHVVKVVAKFPAAVSYVTADKITPDLKPVKIDGKAYDEPGYPLATK